MGLLDWRVFMSKDLTGPGGSSAVRDRYNIQALLSTNNNSSKKSTNISSKVSPIYSYRFTAMDLQ
jgi:hypothetical protein